jgi:hypothetical protein
MKGGWRFQPWQHLGGEKSSQTNEEKKSQHHPKLESPWTGGAWARGWVRLNGSGGRRKKEVRCLYGCRPLYSRLVTPPEIKDRGQLLSMEPLGAPLLSQLVIRVGTKGGPATAAISGHVTERSLVSSPKLNRD